MDAQACLTDILADFSCGDVSNMEDNFLCLFEWLNKGGWCPALTSLPKGVAEIRSGNFAIRQCGEKPIDGFEFTYSDDVGIIVSRWKLPYLNVV